MSIVTSKTQYLYDELQDHKGNVILSVYVRFAYLMYCIKTMLTGLWTANCALKRKDNVCKL